MAVENRPLGVDCDRRDPPAPLRQPSDRGRRRSTRKPGQAIPESAFPTPHETVTLHTRDGLDLAGWYVPSKNGAAIVVVHGGGGDRRGSRRHAAMLARQGYGVLLYDARGRGESEGSPNADRAGPGRRTSAAALDFLSRRKDVDPGRIGGWASPRARMSFWRLRRRTATQGRRPRRLDGAFARGRPPSEGVGRHLGDPVLGGRLRDDRGSRSEMPGKPLVDLARQLAPKPALFIASNELREPVVNRKYAAAYGDRAHSGEWTRGTRRGLAEHPQEYERQGESLLRQVALMRLAWLLPFALLAAELRRRLEAERPEAAFADAREPLRRGSAGRGCEAVLVPGERRRTPRWSGGR